MWPGIRRHPGKWFHRTGMKRFQAGEGSPVQSDAKRSVPIWAWAMDLGQRVETE